jgi:hypothetical protein
MKDQKDKPVSDKKPPKGNVLRLIVSYLWLPVSFILPFSYAHHMATQDYIEGMPGRSKFTPNTAEWRKEEARSEAVRSGVLGLVVAMTIFLMWRLDRALNRNKRELSSAWMVVMLGAFAMLLWTVWTCAGHVMLRAHDEVNLSPAHLPGLE